MQNAIRRMLPDPVSFILPVTGWTRDNEETSCYVYHYDLAANGVTANCIASVNIAYGSQETAAVCGLCPTSETGAGYIRFRAASIPVAAIVGSYWIRKIKSVINA